ncbi:hypothetical protein PRIPAC_90782 [Pristionchus pacificus]|uniref:Uncharacterized protein n=1 Tax=Pristionchus pacificus TaxID=54126 RepID=A0A2A6B6R3_PRIPA|nr:hypothetical protein PRIPAC_90782 [Pristionchus pacificus]|eukprot:PDM61554.1 hypothetical protein PRIPAC_50996 [Pristionchus pacificus]
MDTCLSYIHRFDHCALLGIMNSAPQCTLPITEMVKKTKDADYSIPIPAPPIAAEYIRNPASATGTIIAIDTTRAQPCGAAGIAVIDVTLPDNSHALLDGILWWRTRSGVLLSQAWLQKEKRDQKIWLWITLRPAN